MVFIQFQMCLDCFWILEEFIDNSGAATFFGYVYANVDWTSCWWNSSLCFFIYVNLPRSRSVILARFLGTLKYAYHDETILFLVLNLLPDQSVGNLDSEAFKEAIKNSSLLSRPFYYLMKFMLVSMNQLKYLFSKSNKLRTQIQIFLRNEQIC